ncbi:thioredoxin-related transmembrane protein 1 [Gracilinanus agilis]|uniref:thioredoxin-related transmembrane protein 1 n=1 Tax=Gracilinanus agilis TaxID=191870 RepID=UPI001CFF094E|nr:thioredoxin-related transmembrane protein 1 [Gracilinanus agilis]
MAPSRSPLLSLMLFVLLLWGTPGIQGLWRNVRTITDKNWKELLQGEWMIEFYAPWCPACQNLQPEWEDFAELGEDLEINIAKVDVTEQPGMVTPFIFAFQYILLYIFMKHYLLQYYLKMKPGIPDWACGKEADERGDLNLFARSSEKLLPESARLLKKLEQDQEADEEDISDDELENENPSKKDFSQTAMRQRIVSPLSVVDKS